MQKLCPLCQKSVSVYSNFYPNNDLEVLRNNLYLHLQKAHTHKEVSEYVTERVMNK